jgi:hypothetical protein
VAGDPYFANVVLLCHFDGANGSTTITDNSPSAHSLTSTGPSLTTTQQKFGTASLSQTGAANWVESPDSADWYFGNGRFTVEAWVRPAATISGVRSIVAQFGGSSNYGWFLGWNGTALSFFYSTTGTDNPAVAGTYSPTTGNWVHIAADRDASNVLRVYADGAVIASATVSATFYNSPLKLFILNDGNNTRGLIGQIDDLRITKGVARYAGPFTPPTTAFPDSADAGQTAVTINTG